MAEFVVEFGQDGPPPADGRLDAAAFHRNHQPIWSVLAPFLEGKAGDVLEAGSGTGQHAVEFAGRSPGITWWPSDYNQKHLESIAAWRLHSKLPNIRPPQRIDLLDPDLAPAAGRKPDGRRAAGDSLRQCHPYRALADRGESAGRCRAPAAARRPAVPLRALHARRAAYRRPAMRSSTRRSGPAIPSGACAISPISAPSPIAWACGSRRSTRCRRII